MKIAGKYIGLPQGVNLKDPRIQSAAAGLGAAGLSVAGNAVTGQIEEKDPTRIALEALGAGALGAAGAYGINRLNARVAEPTLGALKQELQNNRREMVNLKNGLSNATLPVSPEVQMGFRQMLEEQGRKAYRYIDGAANAAVLGGAVAGGGLGGVLAGGMANLVGVPQTIDNPESFMSSNSPAALQYSRESMSQVYPNPAVLY